MTDAGAEHRLAAAERYISVAEEQREILPSAAPAALEYTHGLVDQMYERWASSTERFRNVLARGDAPADLQARCRRALARTLVNEAQWVEAIDLHRQALTAFRRQGNRRETARTMTDIGYAYLDMALSTWGGGDPIRVQPPSRLQVLSDVAGWFARLPLVCFLVFQMGPRPMLPVLYRVGRGMDWVIARLLGTAAVWFRRAESRLTALDDQAGLAAVREQQVRLYLALNHPGEAEAISRKLVQTEGTSLGQYRAARAAGTGRGAATAAQGQGSILAPGRSPARLCRLRPSQADRRDVYDAGSGGHRTGRSRRGGAPILRCPRCLARRGRPESYDRGRGRSGNPGATPHPVAGSAGSPVLSKRTGHGSPLPDALYASVGRRLSVGRADCSGDRLLLHPLPGDSYSERN